MSRAMMRDALLVVATAGLVVSLLLHLAPLALVFAANAFLVLAFVPRCPPRA